MARSAGIMIAVLLLACGCLARYGAEKKFDLYATTGYGFGVGGRNVGASQTFNGLTLTKREDHYQNFGWGIKIEGGADYLLMDNLYAQGGLCFNIGVPWIDNVSDDGTTKTTTGYRWSTFGIKALLKPTFKLLDLFDVYTGFGLGLCFAFSSADITQTTPTTTYSVKAIDSNTPGLVFIGSLGAEYPLNEYCIMYGELYCEQMSFTTTKTTYSNASPGGPYIDHIDYYQEDVTDRPPPPKTPGTNIAIRAGVRFPIF
jgi:hypothetical protein